MMPCRRAQQTSTAHGTTPRLKIKDDKINTSIRVPSYINDIAKVEMWCAFVEVVLGEASFAKPIALRGSRYATR
jgi:hypothetical protein